MKFGIEQKMVPVRSRSLLRRCRYVFYTVGILALAYCGYVMVDAKLYQSYQARRFQEELAGAQASAEPESGGRLLPPVEQATTARTEGSDPPASRLSPLGRIEIRAIGLSAMIMEGTDPQTLRRAVGHIAGTPLPGEPGNVALAGHRDTFFRALRNVHEGDEITLQVRSGLYRYRVDSITVVDPDDTRVLNDSDGEVLTLVTCYPFSYLGTAPKRFIVRAHQLSEKVAEAGASKVTAHGVNTASR